MIDAFIIGFLGLASLSFIIWIVVLIVAIRKANEVSRILEERDDNWHWLDK